MLPLPLLPQTTCIFYRAPWEAFFSKDLMHPSAFGYEWWGKALAEQIAGRLEAARTSEKRFGAAS